MEAALLAKARSTNQGKLEILSSSGCRARLSLLKWPSVRKVLGNQHGTAYRDLSKGHYRVSPK